MIPKVRHPFAGYFIHGWALNGLGLSRVSAILWVLILATFTSCSEPLDNTGNERYNVLLITIDTLRADRLGIYGYDKIETPNIDKLALGGIRFEHAYTSCPVTLPAHVSIMTGAYPFAHGVRNNGIFHTPDELVTLAEVLEGNGYTTGAIIGSFVMDARFGLDQGFAFYDDAIRKDQGEGNPFFFPERKADEVTARAQAFMRKNKDKPFFLWAHYFDPHALYQPPPAFARKYPDSPYDGEVAYTDQEIGRLLKSLRLMGIDENTLVILTSDHGEGLGEHNEESHGAFVYDTTVHVPLIISNPRLIPSSKTIVAQVGLGDIMPTVLDILNLEAADNGTDGLQSQMLLSQIQGKSLVPLMTGRSDSVHELLYFETLLPYFDFGWAGLRGVRSDDVKYISSPDPELYMTKEDKKEQHNQYGAHKRSATQLHSAMMSWVTPFENRSKEGQGNEMDEEMRKKLEALGYSSGALHTTLEGDPFQGMDPKARIWVETEISEASADFTLGRFTEALDRLEKLFEKEPKNPNVVYYLAFMNAEMGRLDTAITMYRKLIELQPTDERGWNNLGVLYSQQGRNDEALLALESALIQNPNRPDTHYNMALIHTEQGHDDLAEERLKKAIELRPDYVEALNNLGSLYATREDYSPALAAFKKAIAVDPNHGPAHKNCAQCLYLLGEPKQALKHLDKAIQLGQTIEPLLEESLKPYR